MFRGLPARQPRNPDQGVHRLRHHILQAGLDCRLILEQTAMLLG
jgi:hypothetical protein